MKECIGHEVSRLLSIHETLHVMVLSAEKCLYNNFLRVGEVLNDMAFAQVYSEYYFRNDDYPVVIFKVAEQQEQTSVGQGF